MSTLEGYVRLEISDLSPGGLSSEFTLNFVFSEDQSTVEVEVKENGDSEGSLTEEE